MKSMSGLRILLVIALLFTLSLAVHGLMLCENALQLNGIQMETKIDTQAGLNVSISVEEVSAIEIVGLKQSVIGLSNYNTVIAYIGFEMGTFLLNQPLRDFYLPLAGFT